jgi:hypothetical protein
MKVGSGGGREPREQAAKLVGNCQTCGSPCEGWAVQLTRDNRLRWELDWDCGACGTVSHDGDWGPSPDELREKLLSQHGSYCLRLEDSRLHGGEILKVFRQALRVSLTEAQQAARTLRRDGYEGTLVEAELLRDQLQQEGIPSAVVRVAPD